MMTTDLTTEDQDLLARMRMTESLHPTKAGRLELKKFTVEAGDAAVEAYYGVRMPPPGEYIKLQERIPDNPRGGVLWMSDTPAELIDHLPTARKIADPSCRTVLINGLGLGCITRLAASFDHVEEVTVIDRDPRVIKIVGRWFKMRYGHKVQIIEADAYEVDPTEWPLEPPWDVVWHDIWPTMADHNLPLMRRLHEKYEEHCTWQDSWAVAECMMMHDVDRELYVRFQRLHGEMPDEGHPLLDDYLEWQELEEDYLWFLDRGYVAASREGHPTPLDGLPDFIGRDGTHWGIK